MTYGLDAVAPDGQTADAAADRPSVVCYEAGEWTAVYLDGKLQHVGDTYLADEWIREHFGVRWVQDDAYLRGGDGKSGVAQTLEELDAYAAERDRRRSQAAALRQHAADLEKMARQLDAGQDLPSDGCCVPKGEVTKP